MGLRPSLVLVAVIAAGCAPALSTFQPAHVPPRGTVTASGGFEVGVPVGAISTLIDTGKALAERGQAGEVLSAEQRWQIFDAGINLLLATPSIGPHIAVGYVPADRVELGLRYAGSAWRFGGRLQLLDHTRDAFDLTVGLGLSRFTAEVPLADYIPVLEMDEFTRWQVDVPILIGTSRDWFRVWGGPKLLLTTFDTRMTLTLQSDTTTASFDGNATFIGAQGGIALGYRWLFFAFELTMARGFGTTHVTAPGLDPPVHNTSISSFTIYPSVGLMGEY